MNSKWGRPWIVQPAALPAARRPKGNARWCWAEHRWKMPKNPTTMTCSRQLQASCRTRVPSASDAARAIGPVHRAVQTTVVCPAAPGHGRLSPSTSCAVLIRLRLAADQLCGRSAAAADAVPGSAEPSGSPHAPTRRAAVGASSHGFSCGRCSCDRCDQRRNRNVAVLLPDQRDRFD